MFIDIYIKEKLVYRVYRIYKCYIDLYKAIIELYRKVIFPDEDPIRGLPIGGIRVLLHSWCAV